MFEALLKELRAGGPSENIYSDNLKKYICKLLRWEEQMKKKPLRAIITGRALNINCTPNWMTSRKLPKIMDKKL